MKVCLYGSPPNTPTGMGIVLTNLAEQLSERGHDLVWISRSNYAREWNGHRVVSLPTFGETSDHEIILETLQDERPDAFLTNRNWQSVRDLPSVLNRYTEDTGEMVDVILHAAVESEDVPPGFSAEAIDDHHNPVHLLPYTEPTAQKFAGKTTRAAGGQQYEYCRDYIPHGVSESFLEPPYPEGEVREMFGNPDADFKLVATVAGNESKKNLDLWLRAASRIKERYDGDVKFAMHTTMSPRRGGGLWDGWELPRLAAQYGIHPAHDIRWTKSRPGEDAPESRLSALYADADVYLSMSGGEGFGLPVAEALGHETPCVLTDHMNHRYVAGSGAEYVDIEATKHVRTGEEHLLPDASDAAAKTVSLLEDSAKADRLGEDGNKRVEEMFRWDRAGEKFEAYLQEHVAAE